jgi:hypothetical protein
VSEDKPNSLKIDQILGKATSIKFPPGVIGKTSMALVMFAFSCAAIAWSVRNLWVSIIAVSLLALVFWDILRRVLDFAKGNPAEALLEGAQYTAHVKMIRTASKGHPTLTRRDMEPTEFPQALPAPSHDLTAALPDPELDDSVGGSGNER